MPPPKMLILQILDNGIKSRQGWVREMSGKIKIKMEEEGEKMQCIKDIILKPDFELPTSLCKEGKRSIADDSVIRWCL